MVAGDSGMGGATLGAEGLRVLLFCVGLLALAVTGATLHTRHQWRALRHKLFRPHAGLAQSSRPGRVAERLTSARWASAFGEALGRARRDAAAEGVTTAAAFEAVAAAEEDLRAVIDDVARRAMTGGDLQSCMVRLPRTIVYVLVFPVRHEDRRAFRRYAALSEGWPAHAAALRRAAAEGGAAPPLVALLFFLGLDARDAMLEIAFEGDDRSWSPAGLGELPGGPAGPRGGPAWSYEFALT
jgi:hypothetical protein